MSEDTAAPITITSIIIPRGDVRNPFALLDLSLGDLTLKVMVQRQREKLVMRMPTAANGEPGITVPSGVWQAMADAALAAVRADAAASAHILGATGRYQSGAAKHKPLREPLVIHPA